MKRRSLFTLLWSICLVLILGTLSFLAACAQPAPAPAPEAAPAIIKAVTYAPWERPMFWGYRQLIIRFNERAKREAFIQYLGGGEVIPGFPQGSAVKEGSIDMTNVFAAPYTKFVPEAGTFCLSRLQPLEERASGYYDYLAERFRDVGLFYLGRPVTNVPFYIFTNFKPERWQDLTGRRFAGSGPTWQPAFDGWGIVSTLIPDPEIYSALETGLIDADFEPAPTILDFSFYEVLKYIIDYPLAGPDQLVMINLDTWNKLSPEMQGLMIEIQLEIEAEMVDHYAHFNDDVIKQLVENGMELVTFSEAEGKAYVDSFHHNLWEGKREQFSPEDFLKLKEMTGN